MEEALKVLKGCTVEGRTVKLPCGQLDRKIYEEVKKRLGGIGGQWKGGKIQGFVFEFDPSELLASIQSGANRNLQKEYQSFYTPPGLAARIIELAEIPAPTDNYMPIILEPSAGKGALIEAMWNAGHNNLIYVCEINPVDANYTVELSDDIDFLGEDFLALHRSWHNKFDRIIANPPFSNNQDIAHIRKMYECLKPKIGRLVSVASVHWKTNKNKTEKEFCDWIKDLVIDGKAKLENVPAGTFKESGTNVETCIITINK
jgi:hypothetical protein